MSTYEYHERPPWPDSFNPVAQALNQKRSSVMFYPWMNVNPNQPSPFWGVPPAPQPNAIPPVFSQLGDLGQFIQSMQQSMQDTMQNRPTEFVNGYALEDLIRSFSMAPLMGMLPGLNTATAANELPNFADFGNTMPAWGTQGSNPPALGLLREYQEDWHQFIRLRQEYEAAMRTFGDLFRNFAQRASEKFTALVSADAPDSDFETLYRQWIDCCEAEFQAIAKTPEFSSRLADVINSSLKFTHLNHQIQERLASLRGQPTRGEIDNLQRENFEAQSKINALEEQLLKLEAKMSGKRKVAPRPRSQAAKTKRTRKEK